MRKILFSLSLLFTAVAFGQTLTYPGNGKSGFGGAVGLGSLSIMERGDTVIFQLNKGTGTFDSLLVFYIDDPEINTGIASTSNILFTGATDKYSIAASGSFSPSNQAVLNFPASFKPDLAVAFDKDGGKLFFLADTLGMRLMTDQGTFPVMPAGNNNSPTYTAFTFKSQYGYLPSDTLNFNFMGTYIGQTASRSNEGIGDPFTGYLRTTGYNPYTVQSFVHYSSSLAALPVSLVDFKATSEKGNVLVKWTVAQEINIDRYEVQRSANSRDFATISVVEARNASGVTAYNFTDASPVKGNNYYRLKVVERGGVEYSKVIVIKNGSLRNGFAVTQLGNSLNLQLQDLAAGEYSLVVLNSAGQVIKSATILHDGSDATRQVDLSSRPVKGIYRVVLQSATGTFTQGILVQ